MNPELQAELIRRYPRFFRKPGNRLIKQATSTVEECFVDMGPFDERGIECGDGWFAIVDRLCGACENEIAVLILQGVDKKYWPRVAQIKEKMGGLRLYVKGLISDQLRFQILQAEDDEGESYRTCKRCGAAGKLRYGSGKHTYCDGCEADLETRLRQRLHWFS